MFMEEMPKEYVQAIEEKVKRGVALITDYSGSGQPEHALMRLCQYMEFRDIDVKCECLRACDSSALCRDVLMAMTAQSVGKVTSFGAGMVGRAGHTIDTTGTTSFSCLLNSMFA